MTIELIVVGKTDMAEVASLVDMYRGRIGHYVKFTISVVPDVRRGKTIPQAEQKKQEGEHILKLLQDSDFVALLDEHGAQYSSVDFAKWIEKRMLASSRRLCFIIGGPYGFSDEMRSRADATLSLSKMTFSHQIVRALFAEQLYRAFTILGNEPYHHV